MKNVIRKAVVMFGTSLLLMSFNANASEECASLIQVLETAIFETDLYPQETVSKEGFTGKRNEMDRNGLISKAVAAKIKIESWKVEDSMDKLLAIIDKVDDLTNTPNPSKQKLTDDSATIISNKAMDALDCVDAL